MFFISKPECSAPNLSMDYMESDIGIEFIDIRQNEFNLVMSLVFGLQLKFQRQKTVSSS